MYISFGVVSRVDAKLKHMLVFLKSEMHFLQKAISEGRRFKWLSTRTKEYYGTTELHEYGKTFEEEEEIYTK